MREGKEWRLELGREEKRLIREDISKQVNERIKALKGRATPLFLDIEQLRSRLQKKYRISLIT